MSDRPLLYTAQDVARFCEVDLKTIHHWADAGKIPHHRTDGRHLRFRHNHVVRFLRHHGYPLHPELVHARPMVFYATTENEDVIKKLAKRFVLRRFESAIAALVHVVADGADALIATLEDPTWAGAASIAALKTHASWVAIAAVSDRPAESGADVLVSSATFTRLPNELAEALGIE